MSVVGYNCKAILRTLAFIPCVTSVVNIDGFLGSQHHVYRAMDQYVLMLIPSVLPLLTVTCSAVVILVRKCRTGQPLISLFPNRSAAHGGKMAR